MLSTLRQSTLRLAPLGRRALSTADVGSSALENALRTWSQKYELLTMRNPTTFAALRRARGRVVDALQGTGRLFETNPVSSLMIATVLCIRFAPNFFDENLEVVVGHLHNTYNKLIQPNTSAILKQMAKNALDEHNKYMENEGVNGKDRREVVHSERQKELTAIFKEAGKNMACVYVTGARGSGKSWTVSHVIHEFIEQDKEKCLCLTFRPTAITSVESLAIELSRAVFGERSSEVKEMILTFNGIVTERSRPLDSIRSTMAMVETLCRENPQQKVIFLVDDLEQLLRPASTSSSESERALRAGVSVIVQTLKRLARERLAVPVFVNSAHYEIDDMFGEPDGVLQTMHLNELSIVEFNKYVDILMKGATAEVIQCVKDEASKTIGTRICDVLLLQRRLAMMVKPNEKATCADVTAACKKMVEEERVRLANSVPRIKGSDEVLSRIYKNGSVDIADFSSHIATCDALLRANIIVQNEQGRYQFTSKLLTTSYKLFAKM